MVVTITGLENTNGPEELRNSISFVLRSASNYIPPFLKFIITSKMDVPKEKGRSKLYYITKMLGTQKIVAVSDEEILAAEGAQFRELALQSFDPAKDAKDAE